FSGENITSRKNLPGHITTSAVIINKHHHVLHIKHKFLNKWLLLGGHCEPTDTTFMEAQKKQASHRSDSQAFFRKTCRLISISMKSHPVHTKKSKHWYADFRFLFRLRKDHRLHLQQKEVVNDAWLPLEKMDMQRLANRLHPLCC